MLDFSCYVYYYIRKGENNIKGKQSAMNSVGKTNIGKTYYDYYEFFVNYLKKGAKSKGTQEIYARKVKEFFMFTTGSENVKGLKDHPFANPTVEQFVEYSKYDETISGSTNARTGLNCFIDMLNEYGEKCH